MHFLHLKRDNGLLIGAPLMAQETEALLAKARSIPRFGP
jgi:hypothetical protein